MSKRPNRIHVGDCKEARRLEKLGFIPRRTEDRSAATCRVCCPWLREKDKEDRRNKENDEGVARANAKRLVGIEYDNRFGRVVLFVEHLGTSRWIYNLDGNEIIDLAVKIAEGGDLVVSEMVIALASAVASIAPIVQKEQRAKEKREKEHVYYCSRMAGKAAV